MPYPGLLHPEPCPCGRPLLTRKSIEILRRSSGSVSVGFWVLICNKVCLSPPSVFGGYWVWFWMWFHPSYHLVWASPLPFDVGYLFLVGSNIFLSMVVQQRVVILKFLYSKVILEFFQERRNTHPSNPPSWNLSGSMKLWAMPCRATQDRQVMVESSDKM